ncbi:MAG: DUF4249 domain-containing protein [Flavobacteriia bacterium]|nr:DUF4249 domain-containing protein [Flavobacteriia bacterium]
MKSIQNKLFYSFIALLVILSSCQKVIVLDLKDAEAKYVIEGEINKDETVHYIYISKSVKFSEDNTFPSVSGATVVITDNLGNTETLTEINPGKYATSNLIGVEGRTYTINVSIDGKTFSATSTMPTQVNLDLIYFIDDDFGGKGGKIAIPIRQDPANIQNNYRFDMWVKRVNANKGWERDSAIIIQDDQFADGVVTQQPVFGTIGAFMPGDSCLTTMMCIDKNVYKYFYSLSLNSPGGAATPSNPVSNFTGGCLGYFSAQTKQTVKIEVQP